MKNELPVVAVLMSTYNGEKYIREQLDSIFEQQGVNVKLYVRDDGSSDDTVDIVEEYACSYPIELIFDGENVRPGESFMRLVYKYADEAGIDYYAFADQDDIWLPDKLRVAVDAIGVTDTPTLYSSNQFIYADGENKGNRHKETQRVDLISHVTRNTIAGCTFIFNKSLAQLVSTAARPDWRILRYRLHDSWMMLVAIACGHVIYDDSSHMLYRIHGNNTVGIKKMPLSARLDRLKRYFIKRDDANIRMITAKELLRLYRDYISEHDQELLILYANYQNSWNDRIALGFNKEILENCLENMMVFRIKILTNFV